ncbi:IQ motif and SEC7 domain-containing protein 1-like isoform X2 [Amphiura filiformis]|uniref:IQ motif and SEC7 domain-containing protein 1-like isoform X2 n=1 Tax=Amphiura filiformis TaxID=82378 RepID=UPI003B222F87
MSPLDDDAEQLAQVVWTESPLFRAEPPDFKAYANSSSPIDSKDAAAPLTVKALESELEAAKMDDTAQDVNYQNNNQLESKQLDKSGAEKAGGVGARAESRKQKTQDGATSSDIGPQGVAVETAQHKGIKAAMGSEEEDEQGPMTPVGVDFDDKFDQISVAPTVTSDNEKDVPAVTIASPEGSMKILEEMAESTSSSDSDMSDDDEPLSGSRRSKKQHAMQAIYNQQAARANKQFAKVHSNRMDSPVWKRKSMDTKVASSGGKGRAINGTPTGRMTRSETGDSMSSESSGSSSKYTYEDTSSMADDSVDSLSGESSLFDTSSVQGHVIPTQTQMLSVPMTPMRKRRYRIGVNLFNKKPEKGIKFLLDNKFVENSPNEVAKFLLNRPGFSKIKIGEYLGNLQKDFNMLVLECYVDEMNFRGMHVDEALRRFQTAFRLPGEAQKIERLMEAFAQRYCVCNTDIVRNFHKPDTVFILAFAIIMLHTDLHNPHVKQERKMKIKDFVKNLGGIDDGHDIDKEMLQGIYDRVKKIPFIPGEDHTTTVLKVEQSIVGNRPMLAEPHRRLVCTCSLMEVYDPAKKEKKHIREVFLFNDLLVVTKLYKKKNTHVYGYKKSFPLQGVTVLEFSSQHYPYGIRLVASINNKTLITFCGTNPEDRNRFVADLRETVMEVTEMEDIRIGAELERQKFVRKSQASTADSGLGLDSESLASTQNLSGSIDSLAPPPEKESSLKRTALSNSLMDLKEAAAKKTHRNSAGSLDSGAGIELNATMPLPRKNNRASVGFFSSSGNSNKRKSSGPKIALQLAAGTLDLTAGMESEA